MPADWKYTDDDTDADVVDGPPADVVDDPPVNGFNFFGFNNISDMRDEPEREGRVEIMEDVMLAKPAEQFFSAPTTINM